MLILTAISLVVYFLSTGQRDVFFIKDLALAIFGSAFLSAISEKINIEYIQLDFLRGNKWRNNIVYKKIYIPLWSILYMIKSNKKIIEDTLQEDNLGRLKNTVIKINNYMMQEKDYGDVYTKSWNSYSDDICKELEAFRDKMYFHSKRW